MIILMKENSEKRHINNVLNFLKQKNVDVFCREDTGKSVILTKGNSYHIDTGMLRAMEGVLDVKRLSEPCHKVLRSEHPEDTVVRVGKAAAGGGSFMFIAGPCTIESEKQLNEVADEITDITDVLRGGAFKPRTSPYTFQGLGEEAIGYLTDLKESTGIPVVTEIMDTSQLDLFENVDMIQIGAKNMQNYELLKAVGRCDKPVLLKRGSTNTIQELLLSAEYIASEGNDQIILCERGIRSFETSTRCTLDISAVPVLKSKTHLPVIVDPSHATGNSKMVRPMALAAAVAGADGIMIEVHNRPWEALCDGVQSMTPDEYRKLVRAVKEILPYRYRY